jgi:hypothetical protein
MILSIVELLGDGVLDLSDELEQAVLLSIAAPPVGQRVSLGFLVSLAQGGAHLGQGFLRCLGSIEILVGVDVLEIFLDLSDPGVID